MTKRRTKYDHYMIGFDELEEKFQKMIENVSYENLLTVLNKAGDVVADEMKHTSAFQDRSGKLRKSIAVQMAKKSRKDQIVINIGSKAPHAHLVEFGHGGPQPARPHPFVRPAYDASREEALKIFREELRRLTEPPR